MSDTDSDLGFFPTILRRVKRRVSLGNHSLEVDSDEESLYETMPQKLKKMNKKKRIVRKGGLTNVTYKNISKKRRRYISDLYTTLLDSSWSYVVLLFASSFYGSWILFGVIYYMICLTHGDFSPEHLDQPDWLPCIAETDGFASIFLFSLETQHTIGYGYRQTTTNCSEAMIVVSLQAVLGCIIQAFMVGMVFSKLSRPRNRSKTIIFSNQATITMRNRRLCLIIRIGDLRDDNFILGTQISAKLLRRRISVEGEVYQDMENISVSPETTNESCIFFVWPLDIVHVIDHTSPFYNLTADDLARERFELLIVLEGTNETSNMTFQARTSYLPCEILWGHRFEQMQLYRKDNNRFEINFSAFHSTYEVDTPRYSARHLQHLHTREREHAIIKKAMENESLRSNNPSIRTVGTTTLDNLANVSNQYTVESVASTVTAD